jgi:hypothetical protein
VNCSAHASASRGYNRLWERFRALYLSAGDPYYHLSNITHCFRRTTHCSYGTAQGIDTVAATVSEQAARVHDSCTYTPLVDGKIADAKLCCTRYRHCGLLSAPLRSVAPCCVLHSRRQIHSLQGSTRDFSLPQWRRLFSFFRFLMNSTHAVL